MLKYCTSIFFFKYVTSVSKMSIEVHNPHVLNCLIADAERHTFKAFPPATTRKTQTEIALNRSNTLPVPLSHQSSSADKISVGNLCKGFQKCILLNTYI